MFSPGALSVITEGVEKGGVTAHAETGGNCGACHVAPWNRRTMDERCLDCHIEIESQLDDPTTLHGILTSEMGQFTCRECHTDHNGSEAGLTLLEIKDFPHALVGFALEGHTTTTKGEAFTCADCHGEETGHFELNTCSECHNEMDLVFMDTHVTTFGEGCLACHDGVDRFGEFFDHTEAFPLLGKHVLVACVDCHEGARSLEDLQNLARDCYDCHSQDNPHGEQVEVACQTCHVEEAWEQVGFDHNLTAFALVGEHLEMTCRGCHEDLYFEDTPMDCFSCHAEDDAHAGQFGNDCGFCHSPAGWEEVSFDHSLTAFPLTGKHLDAECSGCHIEGVFVGTATTCAACHDEPQFHRGLFAATCEECHTTDGWVTALFNGVHVFPINHGTGVASSCRTCHPNSLSGYSCYGCHEHTQADITEEHLDEGISNISNCVACHPSGLEDEADDRGGGDD